MQGWDNFFTLVGGTSGTLIGLLFVVLTLGAERATGGDTMRIRAFVAPVFVQLSLLLLLAMILLAPLAEAVRGVLTAILAGAGIAYSLYILALARGRPELTEREPLWDGVLPIAGLACLLLSAASWFFAPEHADELAALAAAVLLITALRNSWAMTLAILSRRGV